VSTPKAPNMQCCGADKKNISGPPADPADERLAMPKGYAHGMAADGRIVVDRADCVLGWNTLSHLEA